MPGINNLEEIEKLTNVSSLHMSFLLCDLVEDYFLSLVYSLLKYELPLFVYSLNVFFCFVLFFNVAQVGFTFPCSLDWSKLMGLLS